MDGSTLVFLFGVIAIPIIAFAAGWFLHDSIFPEDEWWKGGD